MSDLNVLNHIMLSSSSASSSSQYFNISEGPEEAVVAETCPPDLPNGLMCDPYTAQRPTQSTQVMWYLAMRDQLRVLQ